MKKLTLAFALLFLPLGAPVSAQDSQPSPAPTVSFPSQVELVTVDVVITDKKGNPVSNLVREDFTVSENGRPQTTSSFESVRSPDAAPGPAPERPRVSVNTTPEAYGGRSFVVVFDDIHMTPPQAHRAKVAVASFLHQGTREGDRVSLLATGGGAWWSSRMLAGRDELITLLKRLDGRLIPDAAPDRITDHEAMRIHVYRDSETEQIVSRRFETTGARGGGPGAEPSISGDPLVQARAADVYYQAVSRNRITLLAIERVLLSLASARGRKSLVLVSGGFIFDPNLDEFKRVIQASRRANVAMYFLDTRGLTGDLAGFGAEFGPASDARDISTSVLESFEAAAGAESLALDSGGFVVKSTSDLTRGIARIAEDSRNYYLLGYNPSDTTRDGRFRKIVVKVRGKGLQVRARKGYYAPLEDGSRKAEPKPEGSADPDIQAALDSPDEETKVPLRMTAYAFDETLLGKASVVVATDVDVRGFGFTEVDGRFQDTLEYLLVVAHRESGEYFRYDEKVTMRLLPATRDRLFGSWYMLVKDFELAPGGYQAKIVVRDKNTGRLGTVVHEFEVPALGGFRVSTPQLSDRLQKPQSEGGGTPRVAMLVHREFSPDATLYCQFEVYGAQKDKATGMPKVAAGYTIRRKGGSPLTEVAATLITPTSLGRLSRLVGSPLAAAPAGDYEIVLRFHDQLADQRIEITEPFRIEQTAPPEAVSSIPPDPPRR